MKLSPHSPIFDPEIQRGSINRGVMIGDVWIPHISASVSAAVVTAPTSVLAPVVTITFASPCSLLTWVAPAGVTSATFECWGAQGAASNDDGTPLGGRVKGTVPVTPGATYNIYVGCAGGTPTEGFPNGGRGGTGNNQGRGGGGASYVILASSDLGAGITTNALIVAGGAGGSADNNFSEGRGGHGGYPVGGNPTSGTCTGGTASAGGHGTWEDGDVDGQGFGGDGQPSGATLVAEMGGGGGGWHGGGGSKNDTGGGGGGGGSGYVDPSGTFISSDDGVRSGNGLITVTY